MGHGTLRTVSFMRHSALGELMARKCRARPTGGICIKYKFVVFNKDSPCGTLSSTETEPGQVGVRRALREQPWRKTQPKMHKETLRIQEERCHLSLCKPAWRNTWWPQEILFSAKFLERRKALAAKKKEIWRHREVDETHYEREIET